MPLPAFSDLNQPAMLSETLELRVGVAPTLQVGCAHCGQAVDVDAGALPGELSFCCSGCRSVYAVLHDAGLEDYYRYRDATSGPPARESSGRSYAELDDPEFVARHCRSRADGHLGTELYLEGVHCAACVWLVEKVPTLLSGVAEARLDVSRGIVRLEWDPRTVPLSRIAREIERLGYPCHPISGLNREAVWRRRDRALLMKVGVAGAAAGNAMLLAVALYIGAFDGIEAQWSQLFRWGSALVALPAILYCASVFYRGALAAVRTMTPHMDLPVAAGILVGTGSGLLNTIRGRGEIYFDTITMLVFLLLVGRLLQERAQRRADNVAEHLQALSPATARLVDGRTVREVPVDAVQVGAVVEIRAGEHVPVDGIVVEGSSSIDTSLLTGESLPEGVTVGRVVHAGAINLTDRLLVRAECAGQETRLARLVRNIEDVRVRRAPIVVAANELSGYFVVIVLALAAVTFAVFVRRNLDVAVARTVALLVVTCPCALALATPLAISASLARAAERGLLVKGGQYLEALARPGLIVFDKTGTLTLGKLEVVDYSGDEAAQPFMAAAESGSAHPIARALCKAFASDGHWRAESMQETLGSGIDALVSGKRVVVGSAPFVTARSSMCPEWVEMKLSQISNQGHTPVLVAIDGEVRGVAALGDPVRDDATSSLEALRGLGYRLAVLSGDQPAVVRAVVARIGVPFEEVVGGASPESKLAFIEARVRSGPVFMVGDGVNDAAALTAATVGIAVHGGAEASLAAADIFATRTGLAPIVELVHGARRTLRVIRGSLARSLAYNLAVGTLAATGLVGPLMAALLMPLSSLTVVTTSYRARTFQVKK
jgi:Cu2+-exporting ATPase